MFNHDYLAPTVSASGFILPIRPPSQIFAAIQGFCISTLPPDWPLLTFIELYLATQYLFPSNIWTPLDVKILLNRMVLCKFLLTQTYLINSLNVIHGMNHTYMTNRDGLGNTVDRKSSCIIASFSYNYAYFCYSDIKLNNAFMDAFTYRSPFA